METKRHRVVIVGGGFGGLNVARALAGGFTYRADQDDIIITRGGSEGRKIDAVKIDTPVLPGDIVEVTERFF